MSTMETQQVVDANRPSIIFTPNIWGDHFIENASDFMVNDGTKTMIVELKKEVKKMFDLDAIQDARQMLELVDAVQRLGLACHFLEEIETTLKRLHEDIDLVDDDLNIVALRFRLLRQQGYSIPCETFIRFKDKEGKFKESLKDDIRGMLNLYEASHMRYHGEDILDEALIFTTTYLKSTSSKLRSHMSEQVNHALKHPIRKSMQRRESRRYISAYEQEASRSEALLTLAKLDFNNLQVLYKKELSELTRWWRNIDCGTKLLSYLRDRIVECFVWSMAVFHEAEYSVSRITFSKLIAVLTFLDDTFDSFGTLPELEKFAQAMERWDISATDGLPDYMKMGYKMVLEFLSEVEENVAKEIPQYVEYAKKALLITVRAYLHEARLLSNEKMPRFDEYLPMAIETVLSSLMISTTFLGMGKDATKESMNWTLFTHPEPKLKMGLSMIGRLTNDLGYYKSEQRKGGRIAASAVDCYIKQYGVTEEVAVDEMMGRVVSAWKDVNEECLKPPIPRKLAKRFLDLVRASDEMYRDGDGFTQDELLREVVESLIINPVPV